MKQNEKSLAAKKKILETAGSLFTGKRFEATTMQDIVKESGLSKGAIYHYFKSKEDIINELTNEMLFKNNPFDVLKTRKDLTGLQKMKLAMTLNQADEERMEMSKQAIPILKNPRILAETIETNRRLLSPLWLELIEEGNRDGSIHTKYAGELSELIPLLDFWLTPSVFPGSLEEMRHKLLFVQDMLNHMGLPLFDDEIMSMALQCFSEFRETEV